MPISVPNPYSGQDDETCSVSFAAQQQMAGSVGSPQTEADFNKSKLLGELGVLKAKLNLGIIPGGTKVLAYESDDGYRGYYFVKGGKLKDRSYGPDGELISKEGFTTIDNAEYLVSSTKYKVSIPQAVKPKPKPEPVELSPEDIQQFDDYDYLDKLPDHAVVAVNEAGSYITYNQKSGKFEMYVKSEYGHQLYASSYSFGGTTGYKNEGWFKPDGKPTTANDKPKTKAEPTPVTTQVAAPTPTTPVNAGSDSAGSMSHEDVSAMFVKIKDDLAKEKGLNIKGANAALDEEVYKAIGKATGYTPAEVKAKIDAYKAAGNKLSALKKKVLAGTKKVPEGKPQPTKATPGAPLNTSHTTNKPVVDPKPNGVPTVATPNLANQVKQEVKDAVAAEPAKVYTDEDVSAAYIIAKDKVVADSNGKYTLYSKSDELDALIFGAVKLKTGLSKDQAQIAIANYLASGKKLSQLKKSLAKQGAFKPQADTLKKSGTAKTQAEKEAEVNAKADEGYTPTPAPATAVPTPSGPAPKNSDYPDFPTYLAALKEWKAGKTSPGPKVETGKPTPAAAKKKAEENGDISDYAVPPSNKVKIFNTFKAQGADAYLSSGTGPNYNAAYLTQKKLKAQGYNYTLLQIIRVIDEQGAKKAGVDNGKLFEKKVVTWLTTPEGTKYIKDQEKILAKKAEDEAKAIKAAEELAKAAKELEANQPPLPADSAQYQGWDLAKAKRVSETWLAQRPWTAKEKRDLRHYTGSAYTEMNSYLRKLSTSISDRSKTAIQGSKDGMRPTTEPILVQRGTGLEQFQSLGIGRGDASSVWGITGKTFKDEGFLSTSAGGRAAFGGAARLEIECPVGTPMAYVAPISNFPGENEMLLQAGMEYKVLNVRKEGGTFVVRVRVVNWPGKAK